MQLYWPRPDRPATLDGRSNVTISGPDPLARVENGWIVTAYGNVSADGIANPNPRYIAVSRLSFLFFDQPCLMNAASSLRNTMRYDDSGQLIDDSPIGGCMISLSLYAAAAACCLALLVIIIVFAWLRKKREERKERTTGKMRNVLPGASATSTGLRAWCLDFWGVTTAPHAFQARLKAW